MLKREITANVEFSLRLVDRNDFVLADKPIIQDALAGHVPDGEELLWNGDPSDPKAMPYLVERTVAIPGNRIEQAASGIDSRTREPVVYFRFDPLGTAEFADLSKSNVGRAFAMVLNGKIVFAPVIREPILSGVGEISGTFTADTAKRLAIMMNAASVAALFTVIEEHAAGFAH